MLVVRKSFCPVGVPSPACNFACSMMSLQRSPLLISGPEIADSRTGVEAADNETGVATNKIGLAGHKDNIELAGNKDNETGVASNEIGLAANKYTIKLQLTLKRPTVLQCLTRARP